MVVGWLVVVAEVVVVVVVVVAVVVVVIEVVVTDLCSLMGWNGMGWDGMGWDIGMGYWDGCACLCVWWTCCYCFSFPSSPPPKSELQDTGHGNEKLVASPPLPSPAAIDFYHAIDLFRP